MQRLGPSAVMEQFSETMGRAKAGANDAIGDLLEPYRNYLRLLAASQLGRTVGRRVSPSDIVQDTMLAAHRDLGDFHGGSPAEFTGWLRKILARCMLKAIERNLKAEKRDVRREVSMEALCQAWDSGQGRVATFLDPTQATPSQIVSRGEEAVRVADLVSRLPADYQQVIALRNFGELQFDEVGAVMQRSPQAVRMLWLRAIHRLRQLYESDPRA